MNNKINNGHFNFNNRLIFFCIFCFTTLGFNLDVMKETHSFYVFPDAINQSYPWYQMIAKAIHSGRLPLWETGSFSGYLLPGEIQPGVFFPLNLLWVWLFGSVDGISIKALNYLVIFHFSVASVGMYLLVREFHIPSYAAICSAFVYAYSGAVAARAAGQVGIFYGLVFIPWTVMFYIRTIAYSDKKYAILTGVFLGLQVIAGHAQPAIHTAIILAIYTIFYVYQKKNEIGLIFTNLFIKVLIIGISGLFVTYPQLKLSFEYFSNAYRWVGADNPITFNERVPLNIFLNENIISIKDFVNLLDPWQHEISDGNMMFIGILPLFIISIAFIKFRTNKQKHLYPWLVTLILFAFFMIIGGYSPIASIIYYTPILNQIRELGRYVILWQFAASIFVAIGIDTLVAFMPLKLNKKLLNFFVLGLIAALVFGYEFMRRNATFLSSIALYQILISIIGFICIFLIKSSQYKSYFIVILFAIMTLWNKDLYLPKVSNISAQQIYAQNRISEYLKPYFGTYRVMLDESSGLPQNIGAVWPVQTKLGYGATMYKPYFDFINQDWSIDGKINDLLNIKWVISKKPLPLKLIMQDETSGLKLYERDNYYPRIFFKSQLGLSGKEIEQGGSFQLITYSNHYQKFLVRADQDEEVIFSEINYLGWNAYRNEKNIEIYDASIENLKPLLRSFKITKGTHVLEFKYEPSLIYGGGIFFVLIFFMGFICLGFVCIDHTKSFFYYLGETISRLSIRFRFNIEIIVFVIIAIYILVAAMNISMPGLQYDETLFVNAAIGAPTNDYIYSRIFKFPLMLMPYIGALKAYLYMPIFALFGVSVESIRLPSILLSAVTLLLLFKILKHFTNAAVMGVIFVALMASDPAFVFFSRVDFGPTQIMLFLKTLATLLLFKWLHTGRMAWAWVMLLVLLLGLYDKLNFIWVILAFIPAAGIAYHADILSIATQKRKYFVCFAAISSVILAVAIVFVIAPLLANSSQNPLGWGEMLSSKYNLLNVVINGKFIETLTLDIRVNRTTYVDQLLPFIAVGSLLALMWLQFKRWRQATPLPDHVITLQKGVLFFVLQYLFIALQFVVTQAATGPHHVMPLFPLHYLVMLLVVEVLFYQVSYGVIFKKLRYLGLTLKILILSGLVFLCGIQTQTTFTYLRAMNNPIQLSKWGQFEIYELSNTLNQLNTQINFDSIIFTDWGMANQVLSLATFDQTKIRDFWPVFSDDMENPIKENWLDETFFKGKAALIVSRVGKNQYFAQPNTNFKNFAQKRLTGLRLQKTIVDQKENPVFEIFTSVN